MESCPDCVVLKEQIQGSKRYEYVEIGEDVRNLKSFLRLRDNSPVFDEAKKLGSIGIPCFVLEDGSLTLIPEEAGLKSSDDHSIDTNGYGRSGDPNSISDSSDSNINYPACNIDGSGC